MEQPEKDLSDDISVHSHFVRYSKGYFDGPALQIIRRGKTLSIKASPEYEDILGYLVTINIDSDSIEADGTFFAFDDPNETIELAIPPGKMGQIKIRP